MAIIDPYHFEIDGEVLATYARALEVFDGTENIAPRRLREQPAAYVDGSYPDLDTPSFFEAGQQRIRIWISPFDADGAVTHTNGPRAHLRENLENVFALLGGKTRSNHTVNWYVPGPAATKQLQNFARFTLPQIAHGDQRLVRRIDIAAIYPWPFWRDMTTGLQTLGPFTGSQSFTPGGTAPLADAVLTCTSAGRLTHDETGEYVEVTSIPSGSVIINQRPPKTVLSGGSDARDVFSPSHPWGLRFDANTLANLTITGTWQIDYYNAEH